MWWRELGDVGNECTSHNFSLFAIFLPKIIKIGGKLTKFWKKQFCTVFWETVQMLGICVCAMLIGTDVNVIHYNFAVTFCVCTPMYKPVVLAIVYRVSNTGGIAESCMPWRFLRAFRSSWQQPVQRPHLVHELRQRRKTVPECSQLWRPRPAAFPSATVFASFRPRVCHLVTAV